MNPVRRREDLTLLNGPGRPVSTFGGARALGAHQEASLRHCSGKAFEQKQAITRLAASTIRSGERSYSTPVPPRLP